MNRRRNRLPGLSVRIAALLVAGTSFGGDPSLKARVLSEYPRALSEMESFFDRVHGSGTRIHSMLVSDPRKGEPERWQTETKRVEFAFNPSSRKMVTTSTGDDAQDGESYEYVTCKNDRYSFRLRRGSKDAPRVLVTMGPGDAKGVENTLELFSRTYLEAPLTGLLLSHISKVMTDPKYAFEIEEVTRVERDGRRPLKIEFKYKIPSKKRKTVSNITGWIIADPDNHWATQEYEFRNDLSPRPILSGKFEYGHSVEGIPLPRVVSTSDARNRYRFEFDEIAPGPLPEGEFTLAAFGLPEIGKPSANRYASRTGSWLLGAAAVAGALAVALRYLGVRSSRTA